MQSFYSTMIQEMYQLFIVPYAFIGASCMGIFSWMPTVETCSYWINPETWTTSVPFLSPHPCPLISHPGMVLDRASSTKASICAVTAILWIGWKKLMSDTARNCGWSQYPLTLPVTGFPAGCCDLTGSFKAWLMMTCFCCNSVRTRDISRSFHLPQSEHQHPFGVA